MLAARQGDAVHILGHQPPTDGAWLPGYWDKFTRLCSEYRTTIKGQFFGHIHIDQWTLTRAHSRVATSSIYIICRSPCVMH